MYINKVLTINYLIKVFFFLQLLTFLLYVFFCIVFDFHYFCILE